MTPRIVEADAAGIAAVIEELERGGVVGLPTETVYGLAARTMDELAIARVYDLKGRPENNPLIAHVASIKHAVSLVAEWSEAAEAIAREFWPGPVSIVLARAEHVPAVATGGLDSIAIRMPSHPVALEVLTALDEPVSAPSANRSGAVSPTRAEHVAEEFSDEDLLILDGGPCEVGLESAVIDLRLPGTARLLRHGAIRPERIEQVLGSIKIDHVDEQDHAPGTSLRHYAPQTRIEFVEGFEAATPQDAVIRFAAAAPVESCTDLVLGTAPEDVARGLYDALRTADRAGAARILIERVPDRGEWAAIADRLRRASS